MNKQKVLYRYALGLTVILALTFVVTLSASEHRGEVRFGEVPIPGASVRAAQADKTLRVQTDSEGRYVLQELNDGTWTIEVRAPGFEIERREVAVAQGAPAAQWDLKMLPIDAVQGENSAGFPAVSLENAAPTLELSQPSAEAADRLLINGSVINGGATPFALQRAFGNVRAPRSPYRFNLFVSGNNALFDARSFSLTGQNTPRPDYSRIQSSLSVNGPLQIPGLFRMGQFTASYSRTQNRNASVQTALMPTLAERLGNFSASPAGPIDPTTGAPFSGGVIPQDRISPQASALAALYPLPNSSGGRYNYQIPIVGVTHGDNIQATVTNIRIGRKDTLAGNGTFQSTRSDNPDLFGFSDASRNKSVSAGVNLVHRFTPRISATVRYTFNRSASQHLPYFANRLDVSGDAGITGNDRDPRNWGPPSLSFAGGIARLSSGSYAFDRNLAHTAAYTSSWIVGRHNFGYGVDYKRQQFNLLSQQNARGGFTFTGSETGNDFADFLLGIPAASSLAFGNADKYFRQSFTNVYLTDDFRLLSSVTVNAGVRWEYESPVTEKYGRLVNLDIAPGFTSAAPVIAGTSDNALLRPDKSGFQPRVGLAWRPRAASSLVVRAGYGMYRDTSVYRTIADQMAQQSPLSKSLSVQNTPANPFTLADGFRGSPSVTATTFAIDPDFRVGNAQNWNLSLQQDLPFAMQVTVTYLGIKGTHVPQRILPNTFPAGAPNPCPSCPTGFVYLTSNGNTNRHAGTIEVRRRQRNGFEASARYTYSKAIDDAGLGGGNHIAQNWLDLRAERGLSSFDKRHELVVQGQFTTGALAGIGTFWDGWRGKILKDWTLSSQLTVGSGSPLTPVILAPVSGTGVTGTLRPNASGVTLYTEGSEAFLNPLAFTAPALGEWGNAGRNTITGPGEFSLNASLTRTFRVNERVSMDLRVDATNVLNHVTYPNWNTTVNSAQFGLPSRANAMRTLQPSLRVRF
jgi:trimeric autotransporter adhesin